MNVYEGVSDMFAGENACVRVRMKNPTHRRKKKRTEQNRTDRDTLNPGAATTQPARPPLLHTPSIA